MATGAHRASTSSARSTGSLRRLRTDYVDLYQLHHYDPATPIDETLRGARRRRAVSGRARYVGCSNFLAWQVARALGRSEVRGWPASTTVQPRYNLLFRQIERELLPLCAEEGLGVIPYNPIAGGLLSGKHRSLGVPPPEGSRFTLGTATSLYQDRYWHEREFATVSALAALAKDSGAIAGNAGGRLDARESCGHVRDRRREPPRAAGASVAAVDFVLGPELKQRLDELTRDYRMGDAAR